MRLKISDISKKDFRIHSRQHPILGDVILITPSENKHRWRSDELHLRSLLLKPDGTIISSGFFKFKNLGEDAADTEKFIQHLNNGSVRFAEKMDGSLIIRSVVDGHVIFRTRGSHMLADGFEEPVMSLIREKYPQLLNPSVVSNGSLLFEYTSPENRIVIKYDEPSLTLLGHMVWTHDSLPTFSCESEYLKMLHQLTGVTPVCFHALPTDVSQLTAEIAMWKGVEGVVAWCNDGELIIKIKAEEYVKLHTLRFRMTEDRVRKIAVFANLTSLSQFEDILYKNGLDWEVVDFAREYVEKILVDKKDIEESVSNLISEIRACDIMGLPTRKRQALALNNCVGRDRRMMAIGFKILDGDMDSVDRLTKAMILGIPVMTIKSAEEEVIKYIGEKNEATEG